jgi:hypothetical protein
MSLINYVEPINIGNVFVGLGGLIITLLLGFAFYQLLMVFVKWVTVYYNRDAKYEILEEQFMDEIAKEKGIDLDAELLKRDMIRKKSKTFRKKLEEEVYKRMFKNED